MFSSIACQPFVPNKIPNINAWIDASDRGYITENNQDVSAIRNKNIGNGDLVQTVASRQPRTDDNEVNGQNVLTFISGNGDFMRNNNYLPQDNLTLFSVWSPNFATTQFASTVAMAPDFQIDAGDITAEFRNRFRSEFLGVGTDVQNPSNLFEESYISTMVLDGNTNNSTLYINGSQVAQSNYNGSLTNVVTLLVGCNRGLGSYIGGYLEEIISYDIVCTSGEIIDTNKYLGDKWGIAV